LGKKGYVVVVVVVLTMVEVLLPTG
jgi:hypothetical protein